MYNMYASASNNSPSTLTLVRTWYEESTPPRAFSKVGKWKMVKIS